MKKIALKNAARGTAFDYAGQSWILLENDPAGRSLCLSKDITETRAFDEGNCVVAGVPAKIIKRGIRWDRQLI